jgi:hypothetical protein
MHANTGFQKWMESNSQLPPPKPMYVRCCTVGCGFAILPKDLHRKCNIRLLGSALVT